MEKIYYSVDYTNRKKEYDNPITLGNLMDEFQRKTGIEMAILPTITCEAITKLLNNPVLLYNNVPATNIEVLHEEVLWKENSISLLKKYLGDLDIKDSDLIVTDPYIFPKKYDADYVENLISILQDVAAAKIIFVTDKSHTNYEVLNQLTQNIKNEIIVKYSEDFHDRFWLSRKSMQGFFVGTSLNGIGKKISSIQMLDETFKDDIQKLVKEIDAIQDAEV